MNIQSKPTNRNLAKRKGEIIMEYCGIKFSNGEFQLSDGRAISYGDAVDIAHMIERMNRENEVEEEYECANGKKPSAGLLKLITDKYEDMCRKDIDQIRSDRLIVAVKTTDPQITTLQSEKERL